jgi:hypothetical protein
LFLAWPARAQVRLGELSTDLSGTVSPGYSGTYGNQTSSTHNWTIGGSADFTGSYHSPNFLSFNLGLYLNQSRANSNYQSISNASGINASTSIFGGSSFPGAVSYSKAYNSEGNYAIPGVANYVTHGNSDTFGINWSENLPDKPSFSAGYQMGSSQYSVYGTNDSGKNSFHSVNLHSAYRLAGFNMGAFYTQGDSHSVIPQVIAQQFLTQTNASTDAYGFNASHALPLHGSASAGVNRSSWNSSYLGTSSSGTIDLLSGIATVHPWTKFSLSGSANYSDNLAGQLVQSVVTAGGSVPGLSANSTSNSLDLEAIAGYSPAENMQTSFSVERRTQTYLGESYGVTSYGASASYARHILDGNFSAGLTLTDNTADKSGDNTLGFSNLENYSTKILGWQVSGTFGYAQNVQTLLVTYMNSYYNYSGNARKAWGKLNFSAGGAASHTALTQQAGTSDSSQSYNATLGYGMWATATGTYSKAGGQALATGAGLIVSPIPTPVLPPSLVSLFGGNSYSFGLSSTPVKRLIMEGSFSKSTSNTSSNGLNSNNNNEQFNAFMQYQYRKLNFTGGFARLEQGFSGSGVPAQVISSFYLGASRWFKFF